MADGEKGTCIEIEGVESDLRDKFTQALFAKFEKCETEADLKDTIIKIIGDNNIDLDKIDVRDVQLKRKLAEAAECVINEVYGEEEQGTKTYQLSQIVTGIVSFICKPPRFNFPRMTFNLQLKIFLDMLIQMLIDLLIGLLVAIIMKLLSLAFELCENGKLLSFDAQFNINDLFNFDGLTNIFQNYEITVAGNEAQIKELDNCESDEFSESTAEAGTSENPINFMTDLNGVLNPSELCLLLNGTPSDTSVQSILELLEYDYPLLFSKLNDDITIKNFFKDIGKTLNPEVCASLNQLQQTVDLNTICSPDFIKNLEDRKATMLRKKGFDEQDAKDLVKKEREKLKKQHEEIVGTIAKLRNDPNSLLDTADLTVFCKNGKPGAIKPTDVPNVDFVANIALEGLFSTYKMAHKIDFDGFNESRFINLKPKKVIVSRYGEINVPMADGSIKTFKNIETPDYMLTKDGAKPMFITKKSKFALAEVIDFGNEEDDEPEIEYGEPITVASLGIKKSAKTGKLKDISPSELYLADLERFENPKQLKTKIVGVIKEIKRKALRTKHALSGEDTIQSSSYTGYTVVNDKYITLLNKTAKYYPTKLASNERMPTLSDNSILELPPIIQTSDIDIDSEQLEMIKKFANTSITMDQLQKPIYMYTSSSFTGKPYYKTSDGITELVNTLIPNYKVASTTISSENDVFNQFFKTKTTKNSSTNLYMNVFANLLSRQSFYTDMVSLAEDDKDDDIREMYYALSGSYQKFNNKMGIIPFENIGDYIGFQKQALEEFRNDPCAIQDESDSNSKSALAGLIKIPTVRLLVRNHIMKFTNMFMNTLFLFKHQRLYENSELYIQFLIQTFKQDLQKLAVLGGDLSLNFYNIYFEYLDEYYESQIVLNNGLYDPLSGQKISLDQEFSEDFKLNYIFKLELKIMQERYNRLFKEFDNEDLHLMSILSGKFNESFYRKQIYVDFQVLKDGIEQTRAFSATSRQWEYACFIKIKDGNNTYTLHKVSVNGGTNVRNALPALSAERKLQLFKLLRETNEFKLLFDYCFSMTKIMSLIHVENCMEICQRDQFANMMIIASDEAIRNSAVAAYYSNDNEKTDCYNPNAGQNGPAFEMPKLSGMLAKIILQFLIKAPIIILKAIVELTDPNISIASKIRTATSALTCTPLPVLPFSLALLPFTLIPSPISIGPPVIPPLGHIYLGIDLAEFVYALATSDRGNCASLDLNISDLGDMTESNASLCKKGCSEAAWSAQRGGSGIDLRIATDGC
ncbi:MAG: hypothetical protein RIR47_125 [Bacteroidota bacterium]|jgi:hypothetical protein